MNHLCSTINKESWLIKMRVNLLIVVLIFSFQSMAKQSIHSDWINLITTCPKTPEKLSQELQEFDRNIGIKLNSFTIDDYNKIFTSNKKETEVIKVLFPYMIPDQVAFSGIDKTCWSFLSDFYSSLKKSDLKEAKSYIKAWDGCLNLNYKKTPNTAQQLLKCYNKVYK